MPAVNACPERSAYERLIHGELPPDDVERLSQHLADCSSCAAAVETLLGRDTLLSDVGREWVEAPAGEKVPADLTRRLLALAGQSSDRSLTPAALNPARGPDEIGRLAHYRVLSVLGEGGMGVVYLAEDVRLSRTVALKTMKPEVAADPRRRQRFLHEARAAAKVEHDHIVPIYDIGEDRGLPWLAMPLLKGESLDGLLKRAKVLQPARAARLGAQVARGLAAAHAAGLVHRDVKPGNIWVEPEGGGRAKLLDFGLARDQASPNREDGEGHLTRTGTVVGTPTFMAPEQARGEPLDARADLFSLGCVLYRAVTGRLPFQGRGAMGTLLALANETPPTPAEVNPDVPGPLSALIMNLLAKDRSARPTSAATVAAALEALQEKPASPARGAEVTTEVSVPTARIVAPRRQWRLATAAALVLALGGALATGIVVIIMNKDGKEVARVTVPEGGSAVIKPDGDSGNRDRKAAAWVLSIGGTIQMRQAGQERHLQVIKDLPDTPFEVVSVDISSNQRVDDTGLEHLEGLTNLTHLHLNGTRVTDAGLAHLKGLTNLTRLRLDGTRVSDAGLIRLEGLTNLTMLALSETPVSDASLEHLKGLTRLTELYLANTPVSDAGLERLKGLTRLKTLELIGTQINDAGLEHLKGLASLTELYLQNTEVGDGGLVHLKGLTRLEHLQLGGTRVGNAGLEHLKGLTRLRTFEASGNQIGDAGLEHLKGLTNLTQLDLNRTEVSDAGLEHLGGLTRLEWLHLKGTRVTDTGLKHLVGLINLKDLALTGTPVTADGVGELQKALPKCKIASSPAPCP